MSVRGGVLEADTIIGCKGSHMLSTTSLILSVVPLLKESIGILMQRTPPSLDQALPECYQRVSTSHAQTTPVQAYVITRQQIDFFPCCVQVQQLQGVYNLQEPHFWTLCTDVYIGTLKLLVAPDADTRWILSQTHNIFTQVPEHTAKVAGSEPCPGSGTQFWSWAMIGFRSGININQSEQWSGTKYWSWKQVLVLGLQKISGSGPESRSINPQPGFRTRFWI